jgi:alkyl hydroperoxide reductase subunit AhpC
MVCLFLRFSYDADKQDFTFVCPTEILAFNKAIADFQAIGAEIIVSSTDSEVCTTRGNPLSLY